MKSVTLGHVLSQNVRMRIRDVLFSNEGNRENDKCISRFKQRPTNSSHLTPKPSDLRVHQVNAVKNKAKNLRKMTKKKISLLSIKRFTRLFDTIWKN